MAEGNLLCPYDSRKDRVTTKVTGDTERQADTFLTTYAEEVCHGPTGWLCDRCREDRADAREKRMTSEIIHVLNDLTTVIVHQGTITRRDSF